LDAQHRISHGMAQSRVDTLCFDDKTLDKGRLYMEYACVLSPLRETDTLGLARTTSGATGATAMPALLPVARDVRRRDKVLLASDSDFASSTCTLRTCTRANYLLSHM
jgi:hypothetical protein